MTACLAAILVAMVSVQFGATGAEGLIGQIGAPATTALRLALASLALCAALRPWRGGIPAAIRPALLGYGAALGCMNLLFYLALRTVPLGIAVALEFLGPLALTLRHSRHRIDALWILLAAGGLISLLPIARHNAIDPLGAACAVGAGGCWAAYMVVGRRIGMALGARAAALGSVIAAALIVPIGLADAGGRMFAPAVLPRGAEVALFSSVIPYSLEMYALARLPTRLFGTLMALEPAVAALMGFALLHQHLTLPQCGAIAAIMAAAAGAVAGA